MDDSDQSRRQGIEFGDLADDLESASYPLSKDEVLSEYGDRELSFEGSGTATVAETLEPAGVEEFESADDVLETLVQLSGDDAVGTTGQTGRGTSDLSPSEGDDTDE